MDLRKQPKSTGPDVLAELERFVSAQTKRKRTEAAILGTLGIAGVIAVGAFAPGVFVALRPVLPHLREAGQKQTIARAITRLIRQGAIVKDGETQRYRLTRKGELRLAKLQSPHAGNIRSSTRTKMKWDGKWRIVIFDIAEKQRRKRDELRAVLSRVGFTRIQDSVWVYPYQCDEVVALAKMELGLGYRLVYIIADAIENDGWLRKLYGLAK